MMRITGRNAFCLVMAAGLCPAGLAASPNGLAREANQASPTRGARIARFREQNPRTQILMEDERVTRIYGSAFGFGATSTASADAFVRDHAAMLGLRADELSAGGFARVDVRSQPLMFDAATGAYRFMVHYYRQVHQGLPVFRAELRLLARNEPGFPLVLASSTVRPLGDFTIAAEMRRQLSDARSLDAKFDLALPAVRAAHASLNRFTTPRAVIWAGTESVAAAPRPAITFIGDDGEGGKPVQTKRLLVADARTGAILYDENLVIDVDVAGNVSAMSSNPPDADFCEPELLMPMPHARVNVGGAETFTNAAGDYLLPNAGSADVTVESAVRGRWFQVTNAAAPDTILSQTVTPPGPADFVHNAANTSELLRAEVNAYIQSNVVRSFALQHNPAYPTLQTQEFPVVVNRVDGLCPGNAWFDGSSINFCRSSGSRPNTAFAGVVHHEYGHNLVQAGGSGQGQYGEGMSDTVAMLIADNPFLAFGFSGSCGSPLRSALNSLQYPCSGEIHFCGQLISGSVWSTRNELFATRPTDYLDVLSALTINSILLHNGSLITPQITVDFLTLDDDDADLGNGTPNCTEIFAGFGAHNMHPNGVRPLGFSHPLGTPTQVQPDTATTVQLGVSGICATPLPDTADLHFRIGGGSFTVVPMNPIGPDQYEADLPAATCGQTIEYFFSVASSDGQTVNDPLGVPNNYYRAISAAALTVLADYDFEATPAWSTVDEGATDGQWDPAPSVPVVGCNRGAPEADFDGSGQCWMTENDPTNCNSDVDQGLTRLVTEVFDLTGTTDPQVSYARWYSNSTGGFSQREPFLIEVSDDGGETWVELETVGPTTSSPNPEVEGGWFVRQFRIADFVNVTSQFQVRFTAMDSVSFPAAGDIVEAAVDAFRVFEVQCVVPCPAATGDINGDTVVDGRDVPPFVAGILTGAPFEATCAGDFNGGGDLDPGDVAGMVSALLGQ